MPRPSGTVYTFACAALLAVAPPARAQDAPPAAFTPGAPPDDAAEADAAPPEADATRGDPFDPRLRLDLPVLHFRPADAAFAAPAILGVGAARVDAALAGVRVSSGLAPSHDLVFYPSLASGPLRLETFVGPDPGALRGDALGGTLEIVPPEPPFDPYRPGAFDLGGSAGFAADAGGPAGHLRAGFQSGGLSGTASLAGAMLGAATGLAVDPARAGEALVGHALLDLHAALGPDDGLRAILRLDGAQGLVRGGADLDDGFLRLEGVRGTIVETVYRHDPEGPGAITAWALARTSERSLLAFEPADDRWSRSDETLWSAAAGADLAFGRRWWTLDLVGELRSEGVAVSSGRGFAGPERTWSDLLGNWPYRPLLDGVNRSGGSFGGSAGIRATENLRLRTAVSAFIYRLLLPVDPFGQETPDRYSETTRWDAEVAADAGFDWRIGDGLELSAFFETGARPPDAEQLAAAGVDPAADLRWLPNASLVPERSYGGRLALRLDLGLVELGVDYHAQWIDDALTAGQARTETPGEPFEATWRNTEAFLQGGAVSGTVYLHRDVRARLVLASSHGWADDGWNGDFEPADVAPLSVLLELAYRTRDGDLEVGAYGGYRWRPGSWALSPVDERLSRSCVLGEVRCDRRDTAPLGAFLRWSFWESLGLLVRAGDLDLQADGPWVQGFLVGTL
jgi:hypothetical protein